MIGVSEVCKSQVVSWAFPDATGEAQEIYVTVTDGEYIDRDAVGIQDILANRADFNRFLKAIEQAIENTKEDE